MTINRNQWKGAAWIFAFSACFFMLARYWYPAAPRATQWVVLWVSVESLAGFHSLSWAFPQSDAVFYSVFAGGILLRLASLGIAAALLCLHNVPLLIPLVSLAVLYFFFSLLQVPFIAYGLW